MQLAALRCDTFSIGALTNAVQKAGIWKVCVQLLSQFSSLGYQTDSIVGNTLVAAFGQSGPWRMALHSLQERVLKNMKPQDIACNAGMNSCVKSVAWIQSVDVFSSFHRMAVRSDVVTVSTAIGAYTATQSWKTPLHLITKVHTLQAKMSRIQELLIPHNSLITSLSWHAAVFVMTLLRKMQVKLALVTYGAAIARCQASSSHPWHFALQLLRDQAHRSLKPNVVACNSVTSALERVGQWQPSLQLSLLLSSLEVDVCSYGALASACEKGQRWNRAIALLQKSRSESLHTLVTVNAVISAVSSWRMAILLLNDLKFFTFRPSQVTYSALSLACSPSWRLPLHFLAPNLLTCNAALGACASAGHWEDAVQVSKDIDKVGLIRDEVSGLKSFLRLYMFIFLFVDRIQQSAIQNKLIYAVSKSIK